jgi:selenide,water dikinase
LSKLPGIELADLLRSVFGGDHLGQLGGDSAALTLATTQWLVSTDMGRPSVDDPELAGRIACLHAMNDIFACGGEPRYALVQLCFDIREEASTPRLLLGAVAQACAEEGASIVGGHTFRGADTLVGLTVLGIPAGNALSKKGARPGDALMLSKGLGLGGLEEYYFENGLPPLVISKSCSLMAQSNGVSAKAAVEAEVTAMTDVSGFGLLAHLAEMIEGQGAKVRLESVPSVEGIVDTLKSESCFRLKGLLPDNLAYARSRCEVAFDVSDSEVAMLVTPQTNGPLLAACPGRSVASLEKAGFVLIGTVSAEPGIRVC